MRLKATLVLAIACLILSPAFAANQKPVDLTMAYLTFSPDPKDLSVVQGELNNLLEKKIGATVKLMPLNIGAWTQQISLMLASGEKLDLMIDGTTFIFNMTGQVAKNQILPLDDLVAKYGQGIVKSMDPAFLNTGKIGGKLFIIPTVRDFGGYHGIVMRKDIVDELKIDISKIKNLDDVEKTLVLVKEKKPDLVPLVAMNGNESIMNQLYAWDQLGDNLGVLENYGDSLNVVNVFETKGYASLAKRINRWYKNGLILKDAATNKDAAATFIKARRAFAYIAGGKPGFDQQESAKMGTPMVYAQIDIPYTTTDSVIHFGWAIPRNSTNPEKAMQLLNLLYSDPEVYNLLVYGIEGKHYVKIGDNLIDYPKGIDVTNSAYNMSGIGWEMGNQLQGYVFKGNPPDIWKQITAMNASTKKSKALGFIFDGTVVADQIAACTNVINRYRMGIECGVFTDVDGMIAEFNQKLKQAGVEKVISAKKQQLEKWAKESGAK